MGALKPWEHLGGGAESLEDAGRGAGISCGL